MDETRLVPKRPPGRNSRKARAFAAEIARLHAQGYTLEAIREALAEAGVHVSKSTVQREVARHAALPPAVASGTVAPLGQPSERHQAPPVIEPPAAADSTRAPTDIRSGKDIAEAFVRDRITNPLIRPKEQR